MDTASERDANFVGTVVFHTLSVCCQAVGAWFLCLILLEDSFPRTPSTRYSGKHGERLQRLFLAVGCGVSEAECGAGDSSDEARASNASRPRTARAAGGPACRQAGARSSGARPASWESGLHGCAAFS